VDSLSLPETDRNRHGALARIVQNLTLRDISEGTVPHRVFTNDVVPFNLQKQESIVWLFPGAKYYEEKTHREFVGRSQGISVRVAKGVYLRSGSFRGRPIEMTRMEHVDTGTVGITNKSIYFAGSQKAVWRLQKSLLSIPILMVWEFTKTGVFGPRPLLLGMAVLSTISFVALPK